MSTLMTPKEIIKIRERLGVTQGVLAKMLCVGLCSINRWEAGKVPPSDIYIEMLELIRSALKHNVEPARIIEMRKNSLSTLRFLCKVRAALVEAKEGRTVNHHAS